MRTQLRTGAVAVIVTSALLGPGAGMAAAGTTYERGTLIECTGDAGDTPVRVNIYQNQTHGNFLELLVNDGTEDEAGASRETGKPFVVGAEVHAAGRVGGHRMTINGTARLTGEVKRVREVIPNDGGVRIVTTGTHRLLEPVLTVRYDGQRGTLTCDNAFRFNLRVTRTPVGD